MSPSCARVHVDFSWGHRTQWLESLDWLTSGGESPRVFLRCHETGKTWKVAMVAVCGLQWHSSFSGAELIWFSDLFWEAQLSCPVWQQLRAVLRSQAVSPMLNLTKAVDSDQLLGHDLLSQNVQNGSVRPR